MRDNRSMTLGWLVAIAMFSTLGLDRAGADLISLTPVSDRSLENGYLDPETATVGYVQLSRNSLGAVYEQRFALEFDLSAIPAGATIEAASMSLSLANFEDNFGNGVPLEIHGYSGDGSVDTADFSVSNLIDGFTLPRPQSSVPMTRDVTSFLQQLVDSNQSFAGLMIRLPQGGLPGNYIGHRLVFFYSSESGSPPRLDVSFTSAVPEPSALLSTGLGLAILGGVGRRRRQRPR